MSGYSYLDTEVKHAIGTNVQQILREVDLVDPPVCYDTLYGSEKLSRAYFDAANPDFELLRKKIGPDEAAKLRGVLFVREKRVFIQDDNYENRKKFPLGHELGHWRLDWHRELLYICSQFDLSPNARKEMEREANYFASELCFMGQRFFQELKDSALSMDHILFLANKFEMSVEATLRRAVEIEDRICAMLSLNIKEDDPTNFLSVRYAAYSESFKQAYGAIDSRQTFKRDSQFAMIHTDPIKQATNRHQFIFLLGEHNKRIKAEVWQNRWNIFALFQPAMD